MGDRRVAKISVDKQYFRTIFSEGHRSVDSHGGLAFGRLRRRDDKQLAHAFGAVGLQEVDIRMDTAEFLGNSAVRLAHQHRTLIIKRSVHRNGAKRRCSNDATHIGSLFNLSVEEVLDECGEHADDDAEHHTDSQIQGSLGEDLDVGTCAFCTMESFTGDLSPEYRSLSMTFFSDSATELAMSAACFGSPSTTAMFTNAVLVGLVTVTWPARSVTVSSKPRSSMTGLSTFEVVASVGYEVIWLEM